MLETLANLGEFIGACAVVLSLIYISFQLKESRQLSRTDALLSRIDTRLNIWLRELDVDALHSAQEKFFEEELYKLDLHFHEIESLTRKERQALIRQLEVELVYFQALFYQKKYGVIGAEESGPLDYIMALNRAPQRRHWKDTLRLINHYPPDFVAHVDNIVKKFDEVERIMDADQDADFESVFLQVFDVPPPPNWLSATL